MTIAYWIVLSLSVIFNVILVLSLRDVMRAATDIKQSAERLARMSRQGPR